MSGEMHAATHHCEGPIDETIDDARELVYSDLSTLPSFLKNRHPTLSNDLCKYIIKDIVNVFLEDLEKR